MRAVPLAAVFLSALAASAAAGNCLVPMTSGPGEPALAFDAASPACREAASLMADFAKLRAAAGLAPAGLSFSVHPSAKVNAYYMPGGIWFTTGDLSDAKITRETRVATIAHEIGHAVQYRDGQGAWSGEPYDAYLARGGDPADAEFDKSPEAAEYYARKRKLEAHADSIAQELLLRAGFPSDLYTRAHANYFGCEGPEGLHASASKHPAPAQRFINAAMTSGALANERARKASLALSASLGAGAPRADSPYRPAARIEDYDSQGRIKPGRRAAESLRVPPPPGDAGPVRERASLIAMSAVDFWVAEPFQRAVDGLTGSDRVSARVLTACGKPQAAGLEEDYSTFGWAKRIAADLALRAVRRRKS